MPRSEFWNEGRWAKLWRRLKEEPLIPFGLALTCWALYGATKSIRRGDKTQTNRMFRARVYAQGFTVLCICVGSIYWKEDREKRKYYEGLLGQKRAQEKKDAWIRELEARDLEETEERARRARRREARRQGKGPEEIERAAVGELEEELRSPLPEDLRGLIRTSSILGPAMGLWWSERNR